MSVDRAKLQSTTDTKRVILEDRTFIEVPEGANYSTHLFRRVDAKGLCFREVDFRYSVFENCYFRNCEFVNCNFIGAQFYNSNLRGCSFQKPRFDYCRFFNTIVPPAIIERHMPGYENVAFELARSLRMNYTQLGDAAGVRKALARELEATRIHLSKATWSRESYYRDKYSGFGRLRIAAELLSFQLLRFIWGNGESLPKLARTILIVLLALTIALRSTGTEWAEAGVSGMRLFFGIPTGAVANNVTAIFASFSRLILLGMFVSVLVKRFSWRG